MEIQLGDFIYWDGSTVFDVVHAVNLEEEYIEIYQIVDPRVMLFEYYEKESTINGMIRIPFSRLKLDHSLEHMPKFRIMPKYYASPLYRCLEGKDYANNND